MNIMFMSAQYLPFMGGLEVLTGQLMAELQSRGHTVTLLTSKGDRELPDFEVMDGIPVHRTDSHEAIRARDGAAILRVQRGIWECVTEFEPDVIHSHDAAPPLWLYLRLIRDRRHAPIILTLHNVMSRQFADNEQGLPGLVTLMRQADRLTGVSEDVVRDAIDLLPEAAGKMTLVHNGVVPPAVEPAPVTADGPAHLLAIGRLVPQKGFDRAIDAVAQLAPRHPDLRLRIVGVGPLLADLEAQARQLGIADRVEFAGAVEHDDIPALLRDSVAVVMPSRFEGFPLVALEAAWMARPVVGTAAPGLSLAVTDGDNGLLVDPDDPRALAVALESLILDRGRARALGEAARRRAEQHWSLAACADAYEALYRTLGAEVSI
jgi:glycosyltransferase involved in cell wall biosynthesis